MRYFDRDANEIVYQQWWDHTINRKYVLLDRHSFGVTDVVTQWVGLQSEFDEKPIIWCTFSRKFDDDKQTISAAFWFTNDVELAKVKAFHLSLVKEVGIPMGVKR